MAWGDDAPPGYDDVEIDVVRQAAPPMKHTSGSRYYTQHVCLQLLGNFPHTENCIEQT